MSELSLPGHDPLSLARPLVMGIVNATPDSFSDGGALADAEAAAERAGAMRAEGADLIDVGGESTRPGAERVSAETQIRRVVGVIERIRQRVPDTPVSIDTTSARVAAAALDAGASMINDVAAGRDDPAILSLAAERGAPIALMHMKGEPKTMQQAPRYDPEGGVVAEVEAFLRERAAAAVEAGVDPAGIVLDPGIGFGKRTDHNLALLQALPRFVRLGHLVLLGTSRKGFLGRVCARGKEEPPAPTELIPATCATTALGVAAGVGIFRVHDVAANRQAADVAAAIGAA